MSSDSGSIHKFDLLNELNYENERKSKIFYSRNFLLSLSGLEKCKKLPSDFDVSILREFEDTSFERSRIPGSLLSHGFRRNEYGSSPPTRGEVGNYNRGRWESRSSGRIDKEADSKSDIDSDSGKHYTNPARRGWQAPEHDGLLGSGSFPRPPGYISGTSAPKFSPNDNNQHSRSTEPYQPPRPYKAVPFRRETKDSFNDETFGTSEITSEDKAEEERKRRDSFELMRKEQHKAFQERQKLNTDKRKDVFDITTLLEDSRDRKRPSDKNSGMNEPTIAQESTKDPPKSSMLLQSVAARPLVPPGFAGAMQEKKSHPGEVKMVSADNISHASENIRLSDPPGYLGENPKADQMGVNMNQHGRSPDIRSSLIGKAKTDKDVLPALDISDPPTVRKLFGSDMRPNVLEHRNSEVLELKSETFGDKGTDRPATILEELFGSPLTLEVGGFSTVAEQHVAKVDESWSPRATQSSKFAQWFLEEDKKPLNDPIPKPADLFSLIVGGERTASDSDRQTPEQLTLKSSFLGSQMADDHMTSEAKISKSDSKPEKVSAVLTCEDLENAILSGISPKMPEPMSPHPPRLQGWGGDSEELDPPSAKNIDNGASQHLLSLLQKGMMHNGDASCVPHADVKSSNKLDSVVAESVRDAPNNLTEAHVTTTSNLGQSLTLETLFGTAFMKELQSVGAPVSAQRGLAAGSAQVDGILSSGEAELISSRNGHEVGFQGSTLQKIEEQFLLFENLQPQVNNAQLQAQVGPKHSIVDGHGGVRLPEEDSLIAVGDPLNPSKGEVLSSQGAAPFNIADKIAALNGNFIEQRYGGLSEGPLPFHVPFDKREPDPFQNHLHMRPHQQLRPHHSGPNLDSQMKMLASPPPPPAAVESVLHHHHDHIQQSRHHFPPNMIHPPIHHPNTGFSSGFDSPNHHHLTQQMHMAGGHYPTAPHPFQGFVRGSPQADNNRLPGLIHGVNPMQALQFGGQHHPIFGGINDPLFGGAGAGAVPPEMGGGGNTNNQPEALQRLIEMELRSNGKQVQHHPVPAVAGGVGGGPTNQGLFGHERDVGFRYR